MKSLGNRATGARLERMKASPLWVEDRFQNLHPILPNLRDPSVPMPSIKDFICGGERRVPSGPLPAESPLDRWTKRPQSGLRVTWLGHSTMLIEIDGVRVLTDPVWGPRASPSTLVGPKRFQPVPVSLREMPPVDVVLISHDHYDHLDYPTVRALAKSTVPFVVSLGLGAHLEYWGVNPDRITELDWWESYTVPNSGVVLTAAPSQHFSGRGLKDRNSTLWSSFSIRSPNHCVFFSGDTGLTTEYQSIREKLGPFDVVMLEVGAFHPAWGDIHLGPRPRARGACHARRSLHAGALGYVFSRHACLGRTGREAVGTRTADGRAATHATVGSTGGARPCRERQTLVARSRKRRSRPSNSNGRSHHSADGSAVATGLARFSVSTVSLI
jgi:L-ascorbate metabolism protein UlaG (beta-lactamase superfamily)